MRAERKAGELLHDVEKAKGGAEPGVGRRGNDGATMPSSGATPLSAHGISRDQSSRWQKLAKFPEAVFERPGDYRPT